MRVDQASRDDADDAFRDLVRSNQTRLLRLAYGVTGRWASAEDAVQTALEKAYSSWHLVRRAEDQAAYVCGIVIREAVREARRTGRWSVLSHHYDVTSGGGSPEDRLDLASALSGLTPKQRAIVVLRYVDDLPVAEVARILRVGEGTVKRQSHDALRTLRDLLGPQHLQEVRNAR